MAAPTPTLADVIAQGLAQLNRALSPTAAALFASTDFAAWSRFISEGIAPASIHIGPAAFVTTLPPTPFVSPLAPVVMNRSRAESSFIDQLYRF